MSFSNQLSYPSQQGFQIPQTYTPPRTLSVPSSPPRLLVRTNSRSFAPDNLGSVARRLDFNGYPVDVDVRTVDIVPASDFGYADASTINRSNPYLNVLSPRTRSGNVDLDYRSYGRTPYPSSPRSIGRTYEDIDIYGSRRSPRGDERTYTNIDVYGSRSPRSLTGYGESFRGQSPRSGGCGCGKKKFKGEIRGKLY